jgi:signal transduction histidine kinase
LLKLDAILQRSAFPEIQMQNANFKAILSFFERDFEQGYQLYSDALNLRDSIRSAESKTRIAELELEYETAKKDIEIQSQLLIIAKRNRQKNNLLFLVLLLGISTILLFMIFSQGKRRRLAELKLKQQQIQELEQRNKILGLASIIEGQEVERTRIAKDLHDGLGVLLSSVRRQIQNVQSEIKKLTDIDIIGNTEKLVATACEEVRRISHDMMPDALINFGLKEAMADLAEQIHSDHSLYMQLDIQEDLSLTEVQSINLYRIIQEFANNTVKHAKATKLGIKIQQDQNNVLMQLRDNGIGFDLNIARQKGGLGLTNIRSRVDFLKGAIEIDTNEGTSCSITIPTIKENI